jgi:predicted DNA-binding transcriptional regulator AlpA
MNHQIDPLLNQQQTADILSMSEAWLEQSRFRRTGLPYIKIGKSVRYRQSDIKAWIEQHTICANI